MTTLAHKTARFAALALAAAVLAAPQAPAQSLDLQRLAPADASLLVHARHNPERDYQKPYFEEILATIEETDILNRALQIVTSRMDKDDLAEATSAVDAFRDALAPIDRDAVMNAKEFVYAQRMDEMTSQHLVACRMTPSAAAGCAEAVRNLFEMAERNTDSEVAVETVTEGGVPRSVLTLPEGVPFRPVVAHVDDVFLFSSSAELLRSGLSAASGEAESKFDDPRVQEALAKLPEAEDAFVFFDGQTHFEKIRQMLSNVEQQASGNPEAAHWLGVAQGILDEVDFFEYHATVEYTDGHRNCTEALGRLRSDYEDKLLFKMVGSGEPFEDWESWVPADATGYRLSTGVNLHPLYDYVVTLLGENVPDAAEGLERFEAWQDEHDFHVDADLLQAFSGECVSVTLPKTVSDEETADAGGGVSLTALRCHKPERVNELLHRLVALVQDVPFLQQQSIALTPCEDLEGFEELSVAMLQAFGVRPVIGFHDGWMMVASDADAVERVLATRRGEAESIADTEAFTRFGLDVEGPVAAVAYTDIAKSTREAAQLLAGVGAVLPMVVGMAGIDADPEQLKPVQELVALLPDVGKIVAKFDFMEAKLYVVQGGETEREWTERTVTLIRPPAE